MSTKTIKGYVSKMHRDGYRLDSIGIHPVTLWKDKSQGDTPATLIIGPGNHKSEEEVRAMVDEMTMHIDIPVRCISILRMIAAKHGLTL